MSKYIFVGDSVSTTRPGVGATDLYGYKIGTARGHSQIISAGVMGDTSAMGLARLPAILAQAPDAISFMFGINDVGAGVPVSTYKANILAMVQQAKAAGARPTLFTPNLVCSTPYINAFQGYCDALKEVAFAEAAPLVDCYREFIEYYFTVPRATFDLLYLDAQHPAPPGHTFMLNTALKPYNAQACA